MPFRIHAFVIAKHMIEESLLPDLSVVPRPTVRSRKGLFQTSNPSVEHKLLGAADEQMHVIGHDDIAANCDIEFDCTFSKLNESGMCSV